MSFTIQNTNTASFYRPRIREDVDPPTFDEKTYAFLVDRIIVLEKRLNELVVSE